MSADRDQCQENENEKTSSSAIFSWNCLLVFIERSVFLSRKRNCWSATKCFRLTKKIVFVSRCYLVQQTIHPHNNEVTHYFGSQKQESLNSVSLKQLAYVWLQCCVCSLLCELLWKDWMEVWNWSVTEFNLSWQQRASEAGWHVGPSLKYLEDFVLFLVQKMLHYSRAVFPFMRKSQKHSASFLNRKYKEHYFI